jgi:hypothetical protein
MLAMSYAKDWISGAMAVACALVPVAGAEEFRRLETRGCCSGPSLTGGG